MCFLIELFFLVESKLVSSSEEHSPSLITTLFLYTIKKADFWVLEVSKSRNIAVS